MWLKIEHDLDGDFKVSWGDQLGNVVLAYSVGRKAVLDAASTVRKELGSLYELAGISDPVERRARLIRLAAAGQSLRCRLFHDPTKEHEIDALEDWIRDEYKDGGREFVIHADLSIHVPWGLVYDGDVTCLAASLPSDSASEISDFSGFWSLNYSLSTTPKGHRVRSRSKMTRARGTFGLLSLVNSEVHAQIKDDLGPETYDAFERILNPPLGVAHDFGECNTLLNATQQVDILFHFLGHQQGQVLYLGDGNTISYDDYCRLIRSLAKSRTRDSSPYCLLFLNGCETAAGDADLTFRREALREEICGAIATEAVVRRKYAAIFGYRFLHAMVNEGKSVAEAMHELRHEPALWPESLLYGCYAQPDYRIALPAPQQAVA